MSTCIVCSTGVLAPLVVLTPLVDSLVVDDALVVVRFAVLEVCFVLVDRLVILGLITVCRADGVRLISLLLFDKMIAFLAGRIER